VRGNLSRQRLSDDNAALRDAVMQRSRMRGYRDDFRYEVLESRLL
jgi:hypothetical protein